MSNGTVDDRRAAVEIKVSLSSYLISAALTVLGVQVALVTFILDKRDGLMAFGVLSCVGALLLVASMFLGGKGISEAYKQGFSGDWQMTSSQGQFSLQAVLALVGVCCVAFSAFLGQPQPEPQSNELRVELSILRTTIAAADAEHRRLSDRVLLLETEIKRAAPAVVPLPSKKK